MNDKLMALLIKHEGLRLKPYVCTAGKTTIGVGRNLDDQGLTDEEARILLANDVRRVRLQACNEFDWFLRMDAVRQDVIASMIFNMGITRFNGFKRLISALEKKEWSTAASEMMASAWSSQVKGRAVELAQMMRTGQYLQQ